LEIIENVIPKKAKAFVFKNLCREEGFPKKYRDTVNAFG
jgi:hypothetical protein